MLVCLSLVSAVLWLLVSLVHQVTSSTASRPIHAPAHRTAAATHAHARARTVVPSHAHKQVYTVQLPTQAAPTAMPFTPTAVRSLMAAATISVEITVAGPLPTRTPAPTATAIGDASLVVARDVDLSGKPVQQAKRFLSPALKLFAVATLHNVHSDDLLRFLFQKDGNPLPNDTITYRAGVDADSQSFSAWADYRGGAHALPKGHYSVLFYRNGRLEAVTTFVVG